MRPAALALLAAACGGGAHVFAGQRYVDARDCVEPGSALDVLPGAPAPNDCAPRCLVQEGQVYVSSTCPPYPRGVDATEGHPACAAAVAAFRRRDTCLDGGGSLRPRDAGAD